MKTYFIRTFGCQANVADSERIAGDYQARGYRPAENWTTADEIVINTCSVRQRAEDRVKGFLRNVQRMRTFKKPKIILTGCMTHYGRERLLKILPEVDEILSIGEVGFNQESIRKDKLHAWVPISSGCNSFCTYCIVPYARGREKSRPEEEIIEEVKDLAAKGYKKITLLGQNVNSYGLERVGVGYRKLLMNNNFTRVDIPSNQSQYTLPKGLPPFVKLLRKISKIKEVIWIRFLTSNPWDFSDELISEIAGNMKIDRFIHLPVQSGSDRILKLMNRGYTRNDYLKLVRKLKKKVPDVVIGTDIIVGFPGETEKDFGKTVDLARKVGFVVAFVAQYSPRPGTAAARLYCDDVSAGEKKRRWEVLDKMINKNHMKNRPEF